MFVGRGRGHVNTDRRQQLRRPLDTKYLIPMDPIALKIGQLKLESPEGLESIRADVIKGCTTAETLKSLIDDLHKRSLASRQFGAKCAVALATVSQFTVDGSKLRTFLLQAMQKDFSDRERLRHDDPNHFMNAIMFLGEVYRNILLVDNTPILVLADALIEYCQMLIDGSEQEVELAVQQLAYNGKLLTKSKGTELQGLQKSIQSASNSCSRRRGWLQLASDLNRSNYGPLSATSYASYECSLGSEAMATISGLLKARDPVVIKEAIDVPLSSNSLSLNTLRDVLDDTAPIMQGSAGQDKVQSSTGPQSGVASKTSQKSAGDHASNSRNEMADSRNHISDSCNPSGDSRKKYSKYQDGGSYQRKSIERKNDSANWLPSNQPIPEKDRDAWGFAQRHCGGWDHDDRCERVDNFYGSQEPRPTTTKSSTRSERVQKFMGTKEGNRYGYRTFNQVAPVEPPPHTGDEESWD